MTQGESLIPQAVRRPAGIASIRSALLFIICAAGCANANEFTRSKDLRVALPARCDGGEADSTAGGGAENCVRITGYIAAGAMSAPGDGIGGHFAPFGVVGAPRVVTSLGASTTTIVDQPADARPMFLQATHSE